MRRFGVLLVCLIVTCSPAPAESQEATSPEPSMLRLTEEEIVSILGPEESYSVPEIATIVIELQTEARAEIKAAAEQAAADALRPVLADLAGVKAERDSWRVQARNGRWVGFAGWAFGAGCLALLVVHFVVPQTLTIP